MNLASYGDAKEGMWSCLIHCRGAHKTAECEQYIKMSLNLRYSKV